MKKTALTVALTAALFTYGATLAYQPKAEAHCEVPCGIFHDQQRFEAMLENHETIAKSMKLINELASKEDAQSKNQLARWVAQKEAHAQKTQDTIASYFMAQRIKTKDPKYVEKLTGAHAVMVAAMKSKQSVDAAVGDALKESILAFHKVYEGK